MALGYAALVILWSRTAAQLAARPRRRGRPAAFTNYLAPDPHDRASSTATGSACSATSAGSSLWLAGARACGLLMLAWSKPWLDRFHYGPFEWLWRSLSRGSLQPMRKGAAAPAAA